MQLVNHVNCTPKCLPFSGFVFAFLVSWPDNHFSFYFPCAFALTSVISFTA